MRFSLLPKEKGFYLLLNQLAVNAEEAARVLQVLSDRWGSAASSIQDLKDLEHTCDKIVHEIMVKLNKTFVTPIDREDIHKLAKTIDDLVDIMDALSSRLVLFQIKNLTPDFKEMVHILRQATHLVTFIVQKIGHLHDAEQILHACIEIHTFENQGDRIFEGALGALFSSQESPVEIIKWKEIYDFQEQAIDKCEDIADIVWGIVVKYG